MKFLFVLIIPLILISLFSYNTSGIGANFVQITNIRNNAEGGPSWNSNGSKIVYDSGIDYTSGGDGKGLWVMNIDGSDNNMIVNPKDSTGANNVNAHWRPNGKEIVFVRDKIGGGGGIWKVDLDGTNKTRFTFTVSRELDPHWSPDGKRILYSNGSYGGSPFKNSIWVMDSNGKNNVKLTDADIGDYSDKYPIWSKDGEKILFTRSENKNADIWVMNSDGSNQKRLTYNNSADIQPDINIYNKIVFSSNRAEESGYDLWVMDSDGNNLFRLTNWPGNEIEAEWSPNGEKIAFSWDKDPGYQKMDIWVAYFIYSNPPPPPTNQSMIISSPEWQNVVAAVPVDVPVIFSESPNGNVKRFIDEYKPDNIYTLGMDIGLNNSYRIDPGDVPGLFFPNETRAVYAENRDKAILGSQIAYHLGIPMVFNKSAWNASELIDLSGMTEGAIQELYLQKLMDNDKDVRYIVLANMENESSLIAGRIAGFRQGYVVPVRFSVIDYIGEPGEINTDNGVFDIMGELVSSAEQLSERGMFANSSEYRKGEPLHLGIVGDGQSIPFVVLYDPGMEVVADKDGDRLYTDLLYSDLNGDNYFDLSVGRFYGNLTSISLQLERMRLPKQEDAVLIGQYRYRKHQDFMLFGGGMMQAYNAQWALDAAGFGTRRIIENRTSSPLDIDVKGMFEMAIYQYRAKGRLSPGGALSVIVGAWAFLEMGEEFLYNLLEYDWESWFENLSQGSPGFPERLEVLYPGTAIGNPEILGYFGVGYRHWIVPPDDKDEIELMTNPYQRATPLKRINFSKFLYDDHDLSAFSSIEEQVLSSGGMSASSSGIVHDPQTIYFSSIFFDRLVKGNTVGEAMRKAVNDIVPENPLSLVDLFIGSGQMPNIYFKTRYERLLLGDPAYTPVENGLPEHGHDFRIRPYQSYLAQASINSDYFIKKGTVFVDNANDYLVETGKPLIPFFVREIILPKGSSTKDVRFRGFYRTYRRLNPLIVPWDEHYPEGEEFAETYPDKKYWYRTTQLLDGRSLMIVYVPAVIYGSQKSKVLRWGRISMEYESPVEITVKTRDIRLGLTEDIEIEVFNNQDEDIEGTLWVWVDSEEISRDIKLGSEESIEEIFQFTPEKEGDYQVKAVLDSALPSGPRYSDFRVWGNCWFPCWRLPFWQRYLFRDWCGDGCCYSLGWVKNALE